MGLIASFAGAVPLYRETHARVDGGGQLLSNRGIPVEMSEPNAGEAIELPEQIVALRPRLARFARSLTRDEASADDLTQETIARALAAQWRFQPGTNLKAWLFRIMRNTYLNTLRDSASRPQLVSLDEFGAEPAGSRAEAFNPVEADVILRADLRRIGQAYRTLPSVLAVPLYLAAIEELSYAEVAAILDIKVGTVMSRIYRARRRLIAYLARSDP